jgi:hypothetical protein
MGVVVVAELRFEAGLLSREKTGSHEEHDRSGRRKRGQSSCAALPGKSS